MEIPKSDWVKQLEAAANKFWKEEYPSWDMAKKQSYWQKTLEKGMQEQEKMGLAAFACFNKTWHESVQEQEPAIDQFIAALFEGPWKGKWDATAFGEAIKQESTEEED